MSQKPLNVEFITDYVEGANPAQPLFVIAVTGTIFLLPEKTIKIMDILLIILSLVAAYVLFLSISYLLIRLLFPRIEVEDERDVVRPAKAREVHAYTPRRARRQKNLAY